jgi:hypothetical protein
MLVVIIERERLSCNSRSAKPALVDRLPGMAKREHKSPGHSHSSREGVLPAWLSLLIGLQAWGL